MRPHRVTIVLLAPLLTSCATDPSAGADAPINVASVAVHVQKPERRTVRSTSTQPATVHADHQTAVHARVSGYLKKLNVDIGDAVDTTTVLGVIDVPEMDQQLLKQQVLIDRRKAESTLAAAQVRFADAEVNATQAQLATAAANVAKAEAQLRADKLEHERVTDLAKDKSIALDVVDVAKFRFEAAEAGKKAAAANVTTVEKNVDAAKAKLQVARKHKKVANEQVRFAEQELKELKALAAFAELKAPYEGTVVERNVEPGDLVRSSQPASAKQMPLFVIANLKKMRVRVPVPERDAALVKVGAKATINLIALSGEPIAGTVSRISKKLDDETRTMLIEIDLPNAAAKLRPGMFGRVTIELEERPNCVVLPAQLVRYDDEGKSYVYVIGADNRIQSIDVKTGLDDGETIEIVEGLQGTERVVVPGARRVKPGQQVRVVSE